MNKNNKIIELELQLEESLQMLRLVAMNQRTCIEVEEWLKLNYPDMNVDDILSPTIFKIDIE